MGNIYSVSVVIPCYNDAATLARAVDSVVSQTYPNIEIIVVNDCSPQTDLIEKCINNYPKIRYLRNHENVGLAATRNHGLNIARGEIVAFLDADDEYLPDKIKFQVEALEENTIITCGLVNVHPNGRHVFRAGSMRIFNNPSLLIYRNTLNGAGLLASKKLLLKHGGYDTTLRSCEDYDLWLRLLSAGVTIKDIGQPLYLYYFNPLGLSKNVNEISKWELEVIKRHAARMGSVWRGSYHYASAVLFRLCIHLFRGELAKNKVLLSQTITNIAMLDKFPVIQAFSRLIAHARLMFILAKLFRFKNKLFAK
jgi:glycosyltransferase involved in cell wall biosynthesis